MSLINEKKGKKKDNTKKMPFYHYNHYLLQIVQLLLVCLKADGDDQDMRKSARKHNSTVIG